MARVLKHAFPLLALLVAFGLLACGDDGGGDEYVSEGDAICERNDERLVEALPEASSEEAVNEYQRTRSRVARQEVRELRRLDPPEGDRETFDRMLTGLEEVAEASEAEAAAQTGEEAARAQERAVEARQEAFEAAEELGFDACAHGSWADQEPQPEQPLGEVMAEIDRVLEDRDCEGLQALFPITAPLPPAACPAVFDSLGADFNAQEAPLDEFGTAAVFEYEGPGGTESQPLAIDVDRRWKFLNIFNEGSSVGEPIDPRFEQTARDFVEAARAGDCERVQQLLDPDARPISEEACVGLASGRYHRLLELNPELEPEGIGGNSLFGFFALRPPDGEYLLLTVSKKDQNDAEGATEPTPYKVLGISPVN